MATGITIQNALFAMRGFINSGAFRRTFDRIRALQVIINTKNNFK